MTWPELVKALEPLGYRETYEGHRMFHRNVEERRRVFGGFEGEGEVWNWETLLFRGSYAEVADYLQQFQVSTPPQQERADAPPQAEHD